MNAFCPSCGLKLNPGMRKCPSCGTDVSSAPAGKGNWTPEQNIFFEEQERKYRKEIRLSVICQIISPVLGLIGGVITILICLPDPDIIALIGFIACILVGGTGTVIFGVIGSSSNKKLEKLQREKLSLEK